MTTKTTLTSRDKSKAPSTLASAAPTTPRKSGVDHVSLSERQQEIVGLLAQGKSNKEIADYLKIGYGTVKQHLFVLFRKLGVSNRTKAVITANQLMKEYPNDFGINAKSIQKGKLALARTGGHSWRLVSAVVISIPDTIVSLWLYSINYHMASPDISILYVLVPKTSGKYASKSWFHSYISTSCS